MKTHSSLSSNNSTLVTIATLRERAAEMLRVADHLEATEKFLNYSSKGRINASTGITFGPTLVKPRRKMSAATKKKIAAAQRARHVTGTKTPAAKTAAAA